MKNDGNDMTNETITIRPATKEDVPFIKLEGIQKVRRHDRTDPVTTCLAV